MRLRLTLSNMRSVHDKRALFTALAGVPGVRSAEVEMGKALLDCDGPVDEGALRAAIEALGLAVTTVARELPLA
ncbi:MAG: hypothetical protein NTZ43_04100 [Gemmatimonadetes bacterium]|nr:hypothetical protein [Gemmatimonadota bacterium]